MPFISATSTPNANGGSNYVGSDIDIFSFKFALGVGFEVSLSIGTNSPGMYTMPLVANPADNTSNVINVPTLKR